MCLLLGGFSSLKYSIQGLCVWVVVKGGGLGVMGVIPACLREPLFLPCVCVSVFCMTELYRSAFTDTECDVCRSPVTLPG